MSENLSSISKEKQAYLISIVVPTYNRLNSLKLCLEQLEAQTASDFEVIVVDDGSTDGTECWMREYESQQRLRLRYVRQPNSGPARARNVAIALSRAPICLMIGDDILADPQLVATHVALHQGRPQPQVAAIGLTTWCDQRQTITRFMRWLDESGLQFGYTDLQSGVTPCWHHFYTSNLSVKTDTVRRFPFDETFRKAATEDLELGYRIEREFGLEMVFLPDATAKHLHPTTFLQSCQRMRGVGEAMKIFHQLRPELKSPQAGPIKLFLRAFLLKTSWALPLLTRVSNWLTRFWCPNPTMRLALKFHYGLGYWQKRQG